MDVSKTKKQFAWQPFTFGGVAAFGDAALGRLLLVQFVFASLAAGVVVWLLQSCWFPVVRGAIRELPGTGEIRSAKLEWKSDSPVSLGQNSFLGIAVDLKHAGQVRSPADVQIEFGETNVKIISLLGFINYPYPKGWIIPCNREELLPWWGAWSPIILGITALMVIIGLLLIWAAIAAILFIPMWIGAFFGDRELTLGGALRLGGAAQLPGALLVIAALFFYGLHAVDLVKILAALGVSFLMMLAYAVGAPFRRPKLGDKKPNPFTSESNPTAAKAPALTNPFQVQPEKDEAPIPPRKPADSQTAGEDEPPSSQS